MMPAYLPIANMWRRDMALGDEFFFFFSQKIIDVEEIWGNLGDALRTLAQSLP